MDQHEKFQKAIRRMKIISKEAEKNKELVRTWDQANDDVIQIVYPYLSREDQDAKICPSVFLERNRRVSIDDSLLHSKIFVSPSSVSASPKKHLIAYKSIRCQVQQGHFVSQSRK